MSSKSNGALLIGITLLGGGLFLLSSSSATQDNEAIGKRAGGGFIGTPSTELNQPEPQTQQPLSFDLSNPFESSGFEQASKKEMRSTPSNSSSGGGGGSFTLSDNQRDTLSSANIDTDSFERVARETQSTPDPFIRDSEGNPIGSRDISNRGDAPVMSRLPESKKETKSANPISSPIVDIDGIDDGDNLITQSQTDLSSLTKKEKKREAET